MEDSQKEALKADGLMPENMTEVEKVFYADLCRKENELRAKENAGKAPKEITLTENVGHEETNSVPDDAIEMRVYDSETDLRKDALNNPDLINLPDLIDKNCKKCSGRGYTGIAKQLVDGEWKGNKYIFCRCVLKNYNKKVMEMSRRQRLAI